MGCRSSNLGHLLQFSQADSYCSRVVLLAIRWEFGESVLDYTQDEG